MRNANRTNAHLRFSTEIVRRLGEELNPTLDKGVLELVKNAYDADATECRIELRGTDRPGGKVIVEDNGAGMTADQNHRRLASSGDDRPRHLPNERPLGGYPRAARV